MIRISVFQKHVSTNAYRQICHESNMDYGWTTSALSHILAYKAKAIHLQNHLKSFGDIMFNITMDKNFRHYVSSKLLVHGYLFLH